MTNHASHEAMEPASIAAPAANYTHARLTTGAMRWLHTSGVVPIAADGSVPTQLVTQAEVIWTNITAMLTAADAISLTTYVTPGHDRGPVMAVRDQSLGGVKAASTLVIVAELTRPEWLMEISVIAAS